MEKKYYFVGTDEEVVMGDVVSIPFEKTLSNGMTILREVKVKVTEDNIPYLIKENIIEEEDEDEEKEVDEEDTADLIDFDSDEDACPCGYGMWLNEVCDDLDEHERKIKVLEEQVKVLKTLVDELTKPKKQPNKKDVK